MLNNLFKIQDSELRSMKRYKFIFLFIIVSSSLSIFSGCKTNSKAPVVSANAKRYELSGKIVSFDKKQHTVTIDHQAIPNYMDAMTMPFSLYDDYVYEDLKPGAEIKATLIVDGNRSWIENPAVTTAVNNSISATVISGINPGTGKTPPDVTLINQNGKKISFKQYKGKQVLLTFIYTRCPLPDFCPLMSRNFSEIYKELQRKSNNNVHLLSITIDPKYDTPEVLRKYSELYTGTKDPSAFNQWEFATGDPEEIKKTAKFFGLDYWPDKDQISHSLKTALIGVDGKVVKVYPSNRWKPAEILADIE